MFLLTQHSYIFQIISWNWKHLIKRKIEAKKIFWHVILHSYLCNGLCVFFIKIESNCFPKPFKLQAYDQSIQARKKLFCCMMVNNYLYKFLINIEGTWTRGVNEQTPQLNLLYCGRIVRNNHHRCSMKKLFLKISQYSQENTFVGVSF